MIVGGRRICNSKIIGTYEISDNEKCSLSSKTIDQINIGGKNVSNYSSIPKIINQNVNNV